MSPIPKNNSTAAAHNPNFQLMRLNLNMRDPCGHSFDRSIHKQIICASTQKIRSFDKVLTDIVSENNSVNKKKNKLEQFKQRHCLYNSHEKLRWCLADYLFEISMSIRMNIYFLYVIDAFISIQHTYSRGDRLEL